jgi:hypothetical protein
MEWIGGSPRRSSSAVAAAACFRSKDGTFTDRNIGRDVPGRRPEVWKRDAPEPPRK